MSARRHTTQPTRRTDVLPRTAYTVHEAAASLGLSYRQCLGLCRTGQLGSFRAGRYVRVPAAALDEFARPGARSSIAP